MAFRKQLSRCQREKKRRHESSAISIMARKDEEVEGNMLSPDSYALDEEDELITDKEDTTASNGLPQLDFSDNALEKIRALEDRMEKRIKCIEKQFHEIRGKGEALKPVFHLRINSRIEFFFCLMGC